MVVLPETQNNIDHHVNANNKYSRTISWLPSMLRLHLYQQCACTCTLGVVQCLDSFTTIVFIEASTELQEKVVCSCLYSLYCKWYW